MELSGEPIPLSTAVAVYSSRGRFGRIASQAAFSVSGGVLAWRRPSLYPGTTLTWIDRGGRKLGTLGEPARYSNPALSSDDARLAVDVIDAETRDIWIFDLLRGGRTRLTFDPADDFDATWSPDGTRIMYSSDRRGPREIYERLANGSGLDELVLESRDVPAHAEDWALDGSLLVFNRNQGSHADLFVLPLEPSRGSKPVPFLATEFWEDMGQFSPDRRFLAYRSFESGKSEVYVRDVLPDGTAGTGKWQISTQGGAEPRWRRDGKELFYLSEAADAAAGGSVGKLMAVSVRTDGASFDASVPKPLFEARLPPGRRNRYVVTRDGQRFLVNLATTPAFETIQPIELLVNWLP
jgi:Tol biopolymer transport system component